jgi:uncharacterized protein (TIGR00297 family)
MSLYDQDKNQPFFFDSFLLRNKMNNIAQVKVQKMNMPVWIILITFFGMLAAVNLKKLTLAGSLSGGLIAFFVYAGAGFTGYLIMTLFFFFATLATAYKKRMKQEKGLPEHSTRDACQVWANAGLAGLAGSLSLFVDDPIVPIVIASVFSSAMADTISSEMGMVTGKKFFNIISLQQDSKGRDGVISLEGSLWGLAGSVLIASIYVFGFGWSPAFFIIIMAGSMGNLADSVMGALWERQGKLGNNMVNFLNTIVAVVIAVLLYYLSR